MFRNTKKEKELIDREVAVYKQEQLHIAEVAISAFRAKKNTETDEMLRRGLQQLGEYEHEFHQTKETRGIELEKLNNKLETLKAQIAGKEEVLQNKQDLIDSIDAKVEAVKMVIEAKDSEIERLKDILDRFIENQPEQIVVGKIR